MGSDRYIIAQIVLHTILLITSRIKIAKNLLNVFVVSRLCSYIAVI